MTTRQKAGFGCLLIVVLVGLSWLTLGPVILAGRAMFPYAPIVMVLWMGAFVLAQYAYLRILRCPNCGIRFGFGMFRSGLVSHPWPRRRCWSCGADMTAVERHRAAGGAAPAPPSPAPVPTGFPLRWQAIVMFILGWNVLFLLDGAKRDMFLAMFAALRDGNLPAPEAMPAGFAGFSVLPAVAFAFAFAAATLASPLMQRFVLRPGHTVAEIRPLLYLLLAVTGLMIVMEVALFRPLFGME